MARTPHISELTLDVMYPDKYLKAEHLVDKRTGKSVSPVVTIEHLVVELVPMSGGKKANATVVTLKDKQKQWIVNKTNALSIGVLLGSKRPAEWIGKRIQLVVDEDEDRRVKGTVPCIRVLSSPDATPRQAAEYRRAWQGERKGGALCGRLKAAIARMVVTDVAPVEPAPADEPEQTQAVAAPPPDDDWSEPESGPIDPAMRALLDKAHEGAEPEPPPPVDPSSGDPGPEPPQWEPGQEG